MTDEPVSKMPDPKYAAVTDDAMRRLEERLRNVRAWASSQAVHALCADAADALRTATAQLDEARAERDELREAKKKPKVHTMEERRRMSDERRYELYPEDFADGGW